jgi:hypothetical protein
MQQRQAVGCPLFARGDGKGAGRKESTKIKVKKQNIPLFLFPNL